MTSAPGDNLEFGNSHRFEKKTKHLPELAAEIAAFIKNWPRSGEDLGKGMRKLRAKFGSQEFVIFYRRIRNLVGFMDIYELPAQAGQMRAREQELRREHGTEKKSEAKKYKLGPDDDTHWKETLAEMDDFFAGKPTKYWSKLDIAEPARIKEAKAARDRTGLSQSAFARLIGASTATVRSWEQGQRKPDGIASKVLRALGKDPKTMVKLLAKA